MTANSPKVKRKPPIPKTPVIIVMSSKAPKPRINLISGFIITILHHFLSVENSRILSY